jgi:hypothetical protein
MQPQPAAAAPPAVGAAPLGVAPMPPQMPPSMQPQPAATAPPAMGAAPLGAAPMPAVAPQYVAQPAAVPIDPFSPPQAAPQVNLFGQQPAAAPINPLGQPQAPLAAADGAPPAPTPDAA